MTALHYVAALRAFPYEIPVLSVVALLGLGFLNWIGVRELAHLALAVAVAALVVQGMLVWAVVSAIEPTAWMGLWREVAGMGDKRPAAAQRTTEWITSTSWC